MITTKARTIDADALRAGELEELRECIYQVQTGKLEYYVLLTNRKQTRSKKRMPGQDYDPNPALAPHAHKGWLVAAPVNKKGFVYLHIYDEARAQERGEGFGHTRITLQGLRSFEVLRDRPGPLAEPEPETPKPVQGPDPQALMGQAMVFMGQAMIAQASRDQQNT